MFVYYLYIQWSNFNIYIEITLKRDRNSFAFYNVGSRLYTYMCPVHIKKNIFTIFFFPSFNLFELVVILSSYCFSNVPYISNRNNKKNKPSKKYECNGQNFEDIPFPLTWKINIRLYAIRCVYLCTIADFTLEVYQEDSSSSTNLTCTLAKFNRQIKFF